MEYTKKYVGVGFAGAAGAAFGGLIGGFRFNFGTVNPTIATGFYHSLSVLYRLLQLTRCATLRQRSWSLTEAIRSFLWTHPWWHAAVVIIPPILITAFLSWRELRHSAEANNLRREANHLREESKTAVAKIAELQRKRNELEREKNTLMEKIAENTRRPLTQAERNALKLRKYLRKTARVSEGNSNWGGMGAEIVEVSEDNVLTLFMPAGYTSSMAWAVYVHCDELQIVEEPIGSCSLQLKVLKRYGDTLHLGEIRKWEDRQTPSAKPLPRGDTVFNANYVKPGSPEVRRIYIYAPTDGNPLYTLVTTANGEETGVVAHGDKIEIAKKFALIQIDYCAEGFRHNGGSGGGSHGLFVTTRL